MELCGQQKFEEAYESTSAAYRNKHTLEEFLDFWEQSSLRYYSSVRWTRGKLTERETLFELKGEYTTDSGKMIYVRFNFRPGGEQWQIHEIWSN